jgi:hypothetical protein
MTAASAAIVTTNLRIARLTLFAWIWTVLYALFVVVSHMRTRRRLLALLEKDLSDACEPEPVYICHENKNYRIEKPEDLRRLPMACLHDCAQRRND